MSPRIRQPFSIRISWFEPAFWWNLKALPNISLRDYKFRILTALFSTSIECIFSVPCDHSSIATLAAAGSRFSLAPSYNPSALQGTMTRTQDCHSSRTLADDLKDKARNDATHQTARWNIGWGTCLWPPPSYITTWPLSGWWSFVPTSFCLIPLSLRSKSKFLFLFQSLSTPPLDAIIPMFSAASPLPKRQNPKLFSLSEDLWSSY